MNNYITSLASYLYNKISDYQNNETVRKEKPMQWPAGIYFTEKKFSLHLLEDLVLNEKIEILTLRLKRRNFNFFIIPIFW